MVKHLHHLALVQWHSLGTRCIDPAVERGGFEAFFRQLVCLQKQVRVVRHVEHALVLDRPHPGVRLLAHRLALNPMPDQHRVRGIQLQGDVGIALIAKNRRGAGVGIDAREVVGGQRQRSRGLVELGELVQVERAARLREEAGRATE